MTTDIIISWDAYTKHVRWLLSNLDKCCIVLHKIDGVNHIKLMFRDSEDATAFRLRFGL